MKIQIIACLLGSAFFIKAQTFKVTKGEEFETPKNVWTQEVIGSDNTAFYHLRNTTIWGGLYLIQKTDRATGKVLFKKELDLSKEPAYKGQDSYILKTVVKGDKILMFMKISKLTKMRVMMQEYSSADGHEIGTPVVIDELDDKLFSENMINISVVFSPDYNNMMVVTEIKGNYKEQKVKLKLYGGADYARLWEKPVASVFGNSTISSSKYMVDNSGNAVYLFKYLYTDSESDVAYGVGFIPNSATKNSLVAISRKESIRQPDLEYSGNTFVCSGKYWEKSKRGYYFVTLDAEKGTITSESFNHVPDEAEAKFDYKQPKQGSGSSEKEINYFKTLYVNGCFYVLRYHYFFQEWGGNKFEKEILVSKYNKSNTLEWMKVIPRNTCKDLVGLNYIIADKLYLVYYENPKNLEKFPDPSTYTIDKYADIGKLESSVLVCTGIDEKGNLTRKQIDTGGEFFLLDKNDPTRTYLQASNSIIVESRASDKLRRYNLLTFQP